MGNCGSSSKQLEYSFLEKPSSKFQLPNQEDLITEGTFVIIRQQQSSSNKESNIQRSLVINQQSIFQSHDKQYYYYIKVYQNVLVFCDNYTKENVKYILRLDQNKVSFKCNNSDKLFPKQDSQKNLEQCQNSGNETNINLIPIKKLNALKKSQIQYLTIISQRGNFILKQEDEQNDKLLKWEKHIKVNCYQQGFWEKYAVLDKIGEGAFATVYLIANKYTQEKFAAKVMYKQKIEKQENGTKGLQTEIDILRTLNCKQTIRLMETFESESSIYLIMDINTGGTLDDKIYSEEITSHYQIAKIMKQLFEGIKYVHQQKIIHRDLKPDNILFKNNKSLDLVISDFGLATFTDISEYLFLRCGTPGYVAPEIWQAKNKNQYGYRSDIYSLGIILHKLVFKQSPFADSSDLNSLIYKNQKGYVNYHQVMYNSTDSACLDLLQKMLEPNQKLRINEDEALNHEYFTIYSKQQSKKKVDKNITEQVNRNRNSTKAIIAPLFNTSQEKQKNGNKKEQKLTSEDQTTQENDSNNVQIMIPNFQNIENQEEEEYREEEEEENQENQNIQLAQEDEIRIQNEQAKIQQQKQRFHKQQKYRYEQQQKKKYHQQLSKEKIPRKSIMVNGGNFVIPNTPVMCGRDYNQEVDYVLQAENTPEMKKYYHKKFQQSRIKQLQEHDQQVHQSQFSKHKQDSPNNHHKQKSLSQRKKSTPKHYENMDFTSFLEKKIELKNKFLTKMRTQGSRSPSSNSNQNSPQYLRQYNFDQKYQRKKQQQISKQEEQIEMQLKIRQKQQKNKTWHESQQDIQNGQVEDDDKVQSNYHSPQHLCVNLKKIDALKNNK